eukprot:CAMPEP_0114575798 /NCGR_PEP_ID=MMETSP0125-20121206/624_1 /TAXON_ID=485358 ORGANISM="Aristerostoma sp., Strain ATCC 50986" /NCGR_SAMPLE_ID=MMETSP0125 /ASSEMBLY_ACC=CAM_ASM_000245 /LENGTH=42 /DNA_ID= /DNA_START= /DNA_END= /DNA_ORIENTATION=
MNLDSDYVYDAGAFEINVYVPGDKDKKKVNVYSKKGGDGPLD